VRVLGIDCGTEFTGYGIVELLARGDLRCCGCGAIKLSLREPMPARLSVVFYAVNVKSALKLGQVRGVAMLAASSNGLAVAEYSPLSIKSAVVGYGKAEKQQVQHMVTRLLKLEAPPDSPDAADALAIAICHLHTAATLDRQSVASGG